MRIEVFFTFLFLPLTTKLLLAATDGESVENQEAFAAAAVVVVVVVWSILDPLFCRDVMLGFVAESITIILLKEVIQ